MKFINNLRNWRNMKVDTDNLKVYQMTAAAFATLCGYAYYKEYEANKPSSEIPIESFQKYVRIQQEANREV